MDFFAAQDHARKQTKKLVVYFILAVIGIIASIYAVCALLFSLDIAVGDLVDDGSSRSAQYSTGRSGSYTAPAPRSNAAQEPSISFSSVRWWNPQLLATVSGAVLLVILGASALKTIQLRGGGGVVARSLGGRQVDPGTRNADERRLMNVVEEMALASGTPVPEVYILDNEEGINAFAAGHSPHDAAVAVTRGCLQTLNRDELQGVIAHEFAHILNGDMRLNVRLIGILFGILVLAVLGEGLMRSALWSGGARRNSKDNSAMVLLVLGLAVMVIGYIGILFGRLIQSAISRQREYLADASAVQFTRYPDGIANALIRIGAGGSKLHSEHAQETAHMFFANGLRQNLGGGFATHPPLPARIRAIKADWDGKFEVPASSRAARKSPTPPQRPEGLGNNAQGATTGSAPASGSAANGTSTTAGSTANSGSAGAAANPAAAVASGIFGMPGAVRTAKGNTRAEAALAAIGTLTTAQIAHAQELHGQVRAILGNAGSDPLAAKALIYALMLGEDDAAKMPAHLEWLKGEVEPEIFAKILPYAEQIAGQGALYLPLLELAMPALAKLEKAQLKAFGERLEKLAERDGQLTFGELAVVALVRRKIARKVAASASAAPSVADAAQLADAFSTVLSAVLHADALATQRDRMPAQKAGSAKADSPAITGDSAIQTAFDAALRKAPLFAGLVTLRTDAGNQAFLPALETLSTAAFALKKQILAAAAEAVVHDGHVSAREAEWLRLISACLDCPMPPLV